MALVTCRVQVIISLWTNESASIGRRIFTSLTIYDLDAFLIDWIPVVPGYTRLTSLDSRAASLTRRSTCSALVIDVNKSCRTLANTCSSVQIGTSWTYTVPCLSSRWYWAKSITYYTIPEIIYCTLCAYSSITSQAIRSTSTCAKSIDSCSAIGTSYAFSGTCTNSTISITLLTCHSRCIVVVLLWTSLVAPST